jgi:hypothetical protein
MTRNLGAYIPNCVTYDPHQLKTPADAVYLLQHEIDLYEERQDGALDADEIAEVRVALKRVKREAQNVGA